MGENILLELINNAALLLVVGVFYNLLSYRPRENSNLFRFVLGVAVGLIGVALMMNPLNFMPGVIIDARSVLLGVSGFFFGAIPSLTAAVITITFRVLYGGAGAAAGVGIIVSSMALGLLWRRLRGRWLRDYHWLELYLFGVVVHAVMLLWLLIIPEGKGMEVIAGVGLPVMLIYPIGTLLVASLLAYQKNKEKAEEIIREKEKSLRLSEKKFRLLVEMAPEGIFVRVKDYFVYLNPMAIKLLGAESDKDLLGKPILDRFDEHYHELVKGRMRELDEKRKPSPTVEQVYLRMDGSRFDVEVSAAPIEWQGEDGALVFFRDITKRKQLAEKVIQSQKLADLGTLAAGIAHEINSPLQVITSNSKSILNSAQKDDLKTDVLIERAERINRSGWRVAEIVRSLLTYARSSPEELKSCSINGLVQDALLLIEHQMRSWANITVEQKLAQGLPAFSCDSTKISQVLINLLINARDAMPEGGIITIETAYDSENQQLVLRVKDTGVGISHDVLPNIYDPFFTTKPVGKGTGLGLSIVLGIVKAHQGVVRVDSVPGKGTTFELRFDLR